MRRVIAAVLALVLGPAGVAWATDLDELLERSHDASYVADLTISCSTPDGARDAVVRIAQVEGLMVVGSTIDADLQVAAGAGGWSLSRHDGVVAAAEVDSAGTQQEPLYVVEDLGARSVLGRDAMAYRLVRDGTLRAELVFDDETGALVLATTFAADGTTYCQRRFISIDPEPPSLSPLAVSEDVALLTLSTDVETGLPEQIGGFDRLDLYEDEDGFRFAYYSDGFFSFAVFETPVAVELPDGVVVEAESGTYHRSYTAGQVTYTWETRAGGLALIGDLPPDMHEAVLSGLAEPYDAGWLGRFWRRLFG
ncbi:MAG: hypothetical protein R3258_03185 [Acidimicrobiia bacterium]|nr:hypothetical protein [Acidimicrobiia bacterium]